MAISVLELNVDLIGRANHERDLQAAQEERYGQPHSPKVVLHNEERTEVTHVLLGLSYTDDEHLSSESHRL